MSNPLIDKYNELKKKKEEPKKVELDGTITLSKEQMEHLKTFATSVTTSNSSAITASNSYSTSVTTSNSSAITASNSYSTSPFSSFKTYDPHSVNDSFFQVAELIQKNTAKVTSVSIVNDIMGSFSTGMKTVTFEVQVWDIP